MLVVVTMLSVYNYHYLENIKIVGCSVRCVAWRGQAAVTLPAVLGSLAHSPEPSYRRVPAAAAGQDPHLVLLTNNIQQ